jgi:hypothetical protein
MAGSVPVRLLLDGVLDVRSAPMSLLRGAKQAPTRLAPDGIVTLGDPCQGGYLGTLAGALRESQIAGPIPPSLTLRPSQICSSAIRQTKARTNAAEPGLAGVPQHWARYDGPEGLLACRLEFGLTLEHDRLRS